MGIYRACKKCCCTKKGPATEEPKFVAGKADKQGQFDFDPDAKGDGKGQHVEARNDATDLENGGST